jgi:hypothetical protein
MPDRPPGSRLPHFLAAIYGLAIFYASLQPFAGWIPASPGAAHFLLGPWPTRWTRFDVLANTLAYVPFGFFVALIPQRRGRPVVVPYSCPRSRIRSPTASFNSLTNGPAPTRVA